MSRVRGADTTPELRVRSAAHRFGLRFRLHRSDLPGKPDLVFPKHRTAIFVHGCFWHRHPNCLKATVPKSRTDFWVEKFGKNVERDQKNAATLKELGWRVEVIWECETRDGDGLSARIREIFDLN